jgi:predicted nucleotidyltransferase
MGLFQTIQVEAEKRKLPFLVIGGLAVNFYGTSRETADLDLLILRDARASWLDLFLAQGYSIFHDAGTFIQLSAPSKDVMPIDLMLVRESTFTPMLAAGREVEMFGAPLRIPSLDHLIALKLHALRHGHRGRNLKDFLDIENLVQVNKIDMQSDKARSLFLKYGTVDIYEKISQACGE